MYHKNLAEGSWFRLSLAEQLGNIGSEYGRARNWRLKNNQVYFNKAAERALELMDLTMADRRWGYFRLKELARAREEICKDLYALDVEQPILSLENYFNQFALLARLNK